MEVGSTDGHGWTRCLGVADAADVGGILLGRRDETVAELRVLTHERGRKAVEEAEHVVAHQDLAVAVGPGADADRRHGERARGVAGHFARYRLEDDGERASILQRQRIRDQGIGFTWLRRPPDITTGLVYRLRLQAEVPHHRDA